MSALRTTRSNISVGRRARPALNTHDKARAQAIAFRGAVKDGRDPHAEQQAERGAWTLQDAMDYFLGSYADAKGTSEGHIANSKSLFRHHVLDKWKRMKLADITHEQIAKRFRAIAGGTGDKHAPGGQTRANHWPGRGRCSTRSSRLGMLTSRRR